MTNRVQQVLPSSLAGPAQALEELGMTPEQIMRMLAEVGDDPASHQPIHALGRRAQNRGFALEPGALEQALLVCAARVSEPRIDSLPVDPTVKVGLRSEFQSFLKPGPRPDLAAGGAAFSASAKLATLRRFPAGPMDWEISGVPRSWLLRASASDLARLLSHLWRTGGFRPYFHMHVGLRPRNRSLLIEKEVMRSYHRMVRSLELQPGVLGIMAVAWFHDAQAVADYPHLQCINRPYLESGGLIVNLGTAPPDAGFAERNPERKHQYEKGARRYRLGLALWPRDSAIAWLRNYPEFAG